MLKNGWNRIKNVLITKSKYGDDSSSIEDDSSEVELCDFEEITLPDLLEKARLNEKSRLMAADVYKRKFSHKALHITANSNSINENEIVIEDLKVLSKMFKYFGHLITIVSIENNGTVNKNFRKILKIINENCDGLKELKLSCIEPQTDSVLNLFSSKVNIFEYIRKPFNNVESLRLDGSFFKLKNNKLAFNEMFPNLTKLELKYLQLDDENSLSVSFKYLNFLSLIVQNLNDEENIEELILMNPQITTLGALGVSMKLLHFTSIHLPNLKSLRNLSMRRTYTDYLNNVFYSVHFENVEYLTVWAAYTELCREVTFGNLKSVWILPDNCKRSIMHDIWIEFIKGNTDLGYIESNLILNNRQLKTIIEAFPKLNYALLLLGSTITPDIIYDAFKEAENVKTMKIIFCLDNEEDRLSRVNELEALTIKEGMFKFIKIETTDIEGYTNVFYERSIFQEFK